MSNAKTIGEVNGAIADEAERITGRKIHVDLSGSDVQIAREHGEGVLRGFERFPNTPVVEVISYGKGGALPVRDQRLKDAYAFKQVISAGDRLAFNNKFASDPVRYYLSADKDHRSKFSSTKGPIGNGLHEFGHSVATVSYRTESRVERRAEQLSLEAGKNPGPHVSGQISHYASTSRQELTAEVFADVMQNGPHASSLSHELFGIIESGYKEPYR